jgi:uncharacterized membrane protein (UPF0127 family)
MRAVIAIVLATLAAAECERAPPEDFSRRTVQTGSPAPVQGGVSTATARVQQTFEDPRREGRCVIATPSELPAPVVPGPAPGCPPDPEVPPSLPVVHVAFPDVSGVAVEAELAQSEHDSSRGLMYRKSLPEGRGMLFDLRFRDDHKFWMHNTCIPLDLIYVDEDGLIVGIIENAPTLDDEARGVGCPSRWVLEVNAGWSRRHGVKAGQHLKLP